MRQTLVRRLSSNAVCRTCDLRTKRKSLQGNTAPLPRRVQRVCGIASGKLPSGSDKPPPLYFIVTFSLYHIFAVCQHFFNIALRFFSLIYTKTPPKKFGGISIICYILLSVHQQHRSTFHAFSPTTAHLLNSQADLY